MKPRTRASSGVELSWPGKVDARGRRAALVRAGARLQGLERHGVAASWTDRLIHGDNLLALEALAGELEGKVDLVYLDPPFSTGSDFEVARSVGEAGTIVRLPAYGDRWAGGVGDYLAMLDPRIRWIHRLLAPTGSLYVHVDPTSGHAVKLLLDEVFGPASFQREIVWRIGWISGFKTRARNWIRNHDLIFFYVKDPRRFTFNKSWVPHPPGYRRRKGEPGPGVAIEDVWNAGEAEAALVGADSLDSIQIKSFSREKTGYATQKNESLLRRIVSASSHEGDLVLDPFCGSGTTLAVAAALGRRFVGCDFGRTAVAIARRRLVNAPRRGPFELATVVDAKAGASAEPPLEPATPRIDVVGLERGEIELVLRGHAWKRGQPLSADLRAALRHPLDAVDEWSVQWAGDRGPLVPDVSIVRGADRRLADRCGPHRPRGSGPWRVRARIHDVLGGRVDVEWTIERARKGGALRITRDGSSDAARRAQAAPRRRGARRGPSARDS